MTALQVGLPLEVSITAILGLIALLVHIDFGHINQRQIADEVWMNRQYGRPLVDGYVVVRIITGMEAISPGTGHFYPSQLLIRLLEFQLPSDADIVVLRRVDDEGQVSHAIHFLNE